MARPRKTTTVSEDPIDPIEPAAAEEEQILPQTRLEMEVGRQTLARASARLEVPAPAAEPDFQLVLDLLEHRLFGRVYEIDTQKNGNFTQTLDTFLKQ